MNSLSNVQKQQIRNAFTLIDGESRDKIVTKDDLKKLYSTLNLRTPGEAQLSEMFNNKEGLDFNEFSNMMSQEMSAVDDKSIIHNALKVFSDKGNLKTFKDEIQIDISVLKDACCSVQLGEIGSGDNRLSRSTFDKLTNNFIQTTHDGKQIFLASKWLDAYY
ncbi:unnamed protein product [Candida verbasci]|uniref:Uncharacterized protein n=1 Tax=Candida verbasci TaxID=1227364 RepID=A0A9W4XMV9_9ASCO|nr:unnamed protein product [Candida verbasci]